MVILLTLLIPVASWGHPIETWINKIIEYETANKRTNPALINAYAVNQEKLDMYRAAHPRFNFPEHIKDLSYAQAEQILYYFWDNSDSVITSMTRYWNGYGI